MESREKIEGQGGREREGGRERKKEETIEREGGGRG